MTLGTAVILFLVSVAGAILAARLLRTQKSLRIICMTLCIVAAVLLAGYIGLTALFLDAARNQPPTP